MQQRLTIIVETLRLGGPNPETAAWRRKETAAAVYRPEADRCETSLQYLEELFELETKIVLKEGEVKDLVVLDWKTAGISLRTRSTCLSVDNSSKNYIVFNRDGLGISPWRIWTWQIMQKLLGKVTLLIWKPGPNLAKPVEGAHDRSIESTQGDNCPICSEIGGEDADQGPNSPSFPPLTRQNYCRPYVHEALDHQEGHKRLEDSLYHTSHDPGKFDRKSPLMKDDSQVRNTCAQSSDQRAGRGGSDAALRTQEQGEGSVEASDGDDDGDSDMGDDYWKWDPKKQVFWHHDLTTDRVVYCPDSFD